MVAGYYLGVFATADYPTETEKRIAWEVYWLVPWPLPKRIPTTLLAMHQHMVRKSEGLWAAVSGLPEIQEGDVFGRMTTMKVELSTPRMSDTAIAIRHRTTEGQVSMTWKALPMSFFGVVGQGPPPKPIGYRNWRGTWPLGFTLTIDHDPFEQMQVRTRGEALSVRQRLNAAFRAGARIRYRTSTSGAGRHIMVRVKKRPPARAKFDLRGLLADDGARLFLDSERWQQLQGEPARALRPSGVLWDTRRPFDAVTLDIGPEQRAGQWYAWRTRGALRRRKR